MKNPLVSVIIPIYNVEKWLPECVDSVLNQTYKNLEVILVDDGSPDGCPAICDEYATRDPRIKVIHKPNGGLSDARNAGIEAVTGDYVVFIDSDDYWDDPNGITKLYDIATEFNSDVTLFGMKRQIQGTNEKIKLSQLDCSRINGKTKNEVLMYFASQGNWYISACSKFVKSEFIKNCKFEKGLLSEDIEYTLRLYPKINSIAIIDTNFYVAREREGSITHTIGGKNLYDLLKIITTGCENIKKLNAPDIEKESYYGLLCVQLCIMLTLLSRVDKDTKKEILTEVKPYLWLLKYDFNYKSHSFCKLKKLLGLNATIYILGKYVNSNYKARKFIKNKVMKMFKNN